MKRFLGFSGIPVTIKCITNLSIDGRSTEGGCLPNIVIEDIPRKMRERRNQNKRGKTKIKKISNIVYRSK